MPRVPGRAFGDSGSRASMPSTPRRRVCAIWLVGWAIRLCSRCRSMCLPAGERLPRCGECASWIRRDRAQSPADSSWEVASQYGAGLVPVASRGRGAREGARSKQARWRAWLAIHLYASGLPAVTNNETRSVASSRPAVSPVTPDDALILDRRSQDASRASRKSIKVGAPQRPSRFASWPMRTFVEAAPHSCALLCLSISGKYLGLYPAICR